MEWRPTVTEAYISVTVIITVKNDKKALIPQKYDGNSTIDC